MALGNYRSPLLFNAGPRPSKPEVKPEKDRVEEILERLVALEIEVKNRKEEVGSDPVPV